MSDLAGSFNLSATEYLLARSAYPAAMIADILRVAELQASSSILDVGCGSGQATLDFAATGCRVVAIDQAQNALDLLAGRCANFPQVELVNSTFEDFECPASSFDLIICAQAFHWLEPEGASAKLRQLLRPSGRVAAFWHMQDISPNSPQADLYQLNSKYIDAYPQMNPPEYSAEFLQAMVDVLSKDEQLGDVSVSEYPWVQSYQKDMFLALYRSWSRYATLSESMKRAVDGDLANYLDSLSNDPEIHYRTCCILAC
jgi:SAM-dependent methyltransferase